RIGADGLPAPCGGFYRGRGAGGGGSAVPAAAVAGTGAAAGAHRHDLRSLSRRGTGRGSAACGVLREGLRLLLARCVLSAVVSGLPRRGADLDLSDGPLLLVEPDAQGRHRP